ncbi:MULTISPECIES: STAS domain-containing protein [Limnospira]|uniref:STAS domain-containing protein n=1 Tax=Limnospira TaxID=2596745 RepID=UPI00157AAAF2|nr:MAG: STAS domain-containing protein [Limnospira indica BM01]
MTVSLRGTRDVKDNYQIFRLTGLLDAFSEGTFRKIMSKCIDNGPKHIVLDLSQIDFVDSSGLGALVQLVKKAQTNGGTLQIVSNPRVTQTVKLVRLEKFLSLQQTVEDAVAAVKKS